MKAYTIYGPPGTGKTTEVIHRIANMVEHGASPSSVYFLSFTKAAAGEAASRVGLKKSDNFSTIHSLCYRLTRVHHGAVVDYRKLAALAEITGVAISGNRGDDEDELTDGDLYLQVINRASNSIIPVEEAYEISDRPGQFDEFIMFANAYAEWKKAYGFIDFNDMLLRVLGSGIKFSASHLVIDEGQDLSPLQWKVVDRLIELAQPAEVHIAADDDQCLYSWSGANPHGVDEFAYKYTASQSVLTQSWRIPRTVHEVAHGILDNISRRVEKRYDPRQEEGRVDFGVDVRSLDIMHGENVMILARTHSLLKPVEQMMRDQSLPYVKSRGVSLFTNKYAMSIRGVLKAQRGEALRDIEYTSLLKTLTSPVIRGEVEAGNNAILKGKDWQNVIDIPPYFAEYYNSVDVEQEPTIVLSTIHGAKGREADRVVLLAGQTPRVAESMGTVAGADEEHRCMYVGVTRAKHQLDIITDDEGYQI